MMDSIRLDKWLWCARFFKTRSLASNEIKNGRVSVNGQKAKPAKTISINDEVFLKKEHIPYTIIVQKIVANRVGAALAKELYTETPQSIEKREKMQELKRLNDQMIQFQKGRPEKKQRRSLEKFKRGEYE